MILIQYITVVLLINWLIVCQIQVKSATIEYFNFFLDEAFGKKYFCKNAKGIHKIVYKRYLMKWVVLINIMKASKFFDLLGSFIFALNEKLQQ